MNPQFRFVYMPSYLELGLAPCSRRIFTISILRFSTAEKSGSRPSSAFILVLAPGTKQKNDKTLKEVTEENKKNELGYIY
jgi:hypothetical protein